MQDEFKRAEKDLANYIDSASIALSISSCESDSYPLLHVNQRFCDLTGYSQERAIGRNCRFLQSGYREQEGRFKMRDFIRDERLDRMRCSLVNFRADGTPFVNLVFLSRLRTHDARGCYILASQFDATLRSAEQMRAYDKNLAQVADRVSFIAGEYHIMMDQSIGAIANTAASIAQSKLALRALEKSGEF